MSERADEIPVALNWLLSRGYAITPRNFVAPDGHVETSEDVEAINFLWHHATDEQLTNPQVTASTNPA